MSDLYERAQLTALRLINNYGLECLITSKGSGGGINPITGQPLPTVEPQSRAAQCVLLNYTTEEAVRSEGLIRAADKKLLIAAAETDPPLLTDTISVNGEVYTVLAVKKVNPAGINVVYEVAGRIN